MNKEAVILIATRSESKRFPNKVFKKINGFPAIEHLLRRLEKAPWPIVLCVPSNDINNYSYLKKKYDIQFYLGYPDSPLHRMAHYIKDSDQDYVIRITHDDIIIDVQTIKEMLKTCEKDNDIGYCISPEIVEGAGVEIIHRENLIHAAESRTTPTEFVSYFVKHYPRQDTLHWVPRESIKRPYRLTMDYYEDYVLLETVFRECGNTASLDKIVEYLDQRPYLLDINKLPKVSLYTCAYNAEKYIDQTIASVLSHHQYADFEYIVVDDGSTDKTLEKVGKFSHDKRLKIIVNEKNVGLASSSNVALDNCRGKYVMRIDADDLLAPYAISNMISEIEEQKTDVVYSGYKLIRESGESYSQAIDPRMHHHAGCALMDKRMINEIRFTNGLKHYDSLDLYNKIKNRAKISYLYDQQWFYRKHENSLSAKNTKDRVKTLKKLQRKRYD